MKTNKPGINLAIIFSVAMFLFQACVLPTPTPDQSSAIIITIVVEVTRHTSNIIPSRTPYPPPTQRATITPYPTASPIAPIKMPTSIVRSQPPAQPPAANSPSNSPVIQQTNCSIYADAKAQYRSNVNFSNAYYGPPISMYQSWVERDIANRDALSLTQDQSSLAQAQNALSEALADQEKQYKAAVPKACR
ncbi:MAG: hypothetical protein NTW32_21015 [Chloroflexi bacterium]|nr:hypothetical protein [Chloroflexota bacterium]